MSVLTIKNKALQTDMLREAARLMQLAACIDDTYAGEINVLIHRVEAKADELEARIGEPVPKHFKPEEQEPKLTIV